MVASCVPSPALAAFVGVSEDRAPVARGLFRERVKLRDQASAKRWEAYRDKVAREKALCGITADKATPHHTNGDAARELVYNEPDAKGAAPPPHRPARREIVPPPPKVPFFKDSKKKCFGAPKEGWALNEAEAGLSHERAKRKGDRDALKYWKTRGAVPADKPTNIPCAVGKGSYPAELNSRTAIQHLYIDRSIGSGLDYDEDKVPLFSSFSNDKKFLDPAIRELERMKRMQRQTVRKTTPHNMASDPVRNDLVNCLTEMMRASPGSLTSGAATARPIRPSPPSPPGQDSAHLGAANPAAHPSGAQTHRTPVTQHSPGVATATPRARVVVGFASRASTPAPTPGRVRPETPVSTRACEVAAMIARELAATPIPPPPVPPGAAGPARASPATSKRVSGASQVSQRSNVPRVEERVGPDDAPQPQHSAGGGEENKLERLLTTRTSLSDPPAPRSSAGSLHADLPSELTQPHAPPNIRSAQSFDTSFDLPSCEIPMPMPADPNDVALSSCTPPPACVHSRGGGVAPHPPPPPSSRSTMERTPGPTLCSTPYSAYSRPGTATSIPFATFTNLSS